MKKVTVIVPIYNALNDVKKLLESFLTCFDFIQGSVILINDCSDSETSDYLNSFSKQHSEIQLINNEKNLGFVKTCNKGMRLAETDIVVLLNSDTIIPQGFVQRIIDCFEFDLKIGLASPISSNSNAYYIYMCDGYTIEKMNEEIRSKHEKIYPMIPEAEGFCFCIRKKVIEQQGFLDEIFGKGYHEEVDFSYRAITNGWKIVLIDDLYVYHKRQASFGSEEREKLLKQNDSIFYSRWQGFRQKYKEDNNLVNPVIAIEEEVFKTEDKKKNFKIMPIKNKILVHLHLYYHNQLDFMIKKLKNINGCDWDLYVTLCEEKPESIKKIIKFKKDAQIIKVENRGYDIWPFIQVLRMVNIDDYNVVLKIHTKNFSKRNINFIGIKFKGWFWRNSLIDALIGSKKTFKRNIEKFLNTNIGMIYDEKFNLPLSEEKDEDTFLLEDLKKVLKINSTCKNFCAGTMFMIKSEILKKIIVSNINKNDFEEKGYTSSKGQFVHALERIFTTLTIEEGFEVYTPKQDFKHFSVTKPKFSFIMPTYNRAFCITKAIDSLLNQTNQNFELIIVDDGSTDNTEEILREKYSKELKNRKIKYFKFRKNRGVSYARNFGLKKAKNQWIAYLDSDNILDVSYTQDFSEAIKKHPKNKLFYSKLKTTNNVVLGKPFNYQDLKVRNYIDMGVFVHKKSLVKKYKGFDTELKRLVDWDLIVRYSTFCRPIFIDKVLLYYNAGEHIRITNSEDREKALKRVKIKFILYLYDEFKNFNMMKFLKRKIKNRKLMFWGASLFLESVISEKEKDPKILGVIDKNPQKHGTKICNYEIFPPEALSELKPDCVFFAIMNYPHLYIEVKKYLEENHPDIELLPNIFG